MTRRHLATAVRLALVALLGTLSLVVVAPAASAAVEEGIGHKTTPGQSWGGRDRAYDWLGSYVVNGEHVFCVSFALKAPDSGERYKPGDELLTKWGEPLPDDVAANISYLLLRYGDTTMPMRRRRSPTCCTLTAASQLRRPRSGEAVHRDRLRRGRTLPTCQSRTGRGGTFAPTPRPIAPLTATVTAPEGSSSNPGAVVGGRHERRGKGIPVWR